MFDFFFVMGLVFIVLIVLGVREKWKYKRTDTNKTGIEK